MTDIQREARVTWTGNLSRGAGKITAASGALNGVAYSVPSRFESAKGTNPEELIAAAHAACFSMMLAKTLGDAQKTPKEIQTKAVLTMGQRGGGWKIVKIHLDTELSADDLDESTAEKAAQTAKEQCPVSLLLKPGLEEISLTVHVRKN
jgi:lipoyl-dependent peroxiredoxin